MAQTATRQRRKEQKGVVLKAKMHKTIVVEVESRFRHPKYGKVVKRIKKYYVHDEKSEAKAGDFVRIMETRPLSKLKRWRLVEVLRSQQGEAGPVTATS
ncbi:MAG: 30S ribosomal protein S17 [bacterium]|jgi:small subunit ribosomal protein S17|nr:30S ribosomal protein S17 [bacterium]